MSGRINELREFGSFRLDVSNRVLWAGGEPVDLPLKEIELLCLLTERPGETLEKDYLIAGLWGDTFVEESNLSRYVYRLRRTFARFGLPADLIRTVPRRGYRFTGEVIGRTPERLVLQRHSITRTTIEEVPSAASEQRQLLSLRGRALLAIGVAIPVVLAVGLLVMMTRTSGGSEMVVNSMAVLPLTSVSSNPDDQMLALGVADSLAGQVGRVAGLRLVSVRSNSENLAADPARLGRELNVDSVLEGVVQRNGNDIRISLRLLRSSDGMQLWTTTLREDGNRVFEIQDRLAAEIADAIARTLNPSGQKHPTESRDAYEAFLRGRFFLDKRERSAYKLARSEFERAIAIDPRFSLAYSGLADTLALQANIATSEKRSTLYAQAKRMAERAIETDPSSTAAFTSLGWIQRTHEWDWKGAERSFLRAIELDPNYANARQWYSLLLTSLGRHDEAAQQLAKARELEPLSRSVHLNSFAVEQYRRSVDNLAAIADMVDRLQPNDTTNYRLRAIVHLRRGELKSVVSTVEREIQANGGKLGGSYSAACLAIAYFRLGDMANYSRVSKLLEERSASNTEALYRLAMVFAAVGDSDKAIRSLERCLRERDDRMIWINVEPEFDALRSDPRFIEISRAMGPALG